MRCTWDFHKCMQRESSVRISSIFPGAFIVHELEIVKFSTCFLQIVVKLLHGSPGTITHSDHHYREWVLRSFHNSGDVTCFVIHLPIRNYHKNVILQKIKNNLMENITIFINSTFLANFQHIFKFLFLELKVKMVKNESSARHYCFMNLKSSAKMILLFEEICEITYRNRCQHNRIKF